MGWYRQDVDAAVRKIKEACPLIVVEYFDYGYGLDCYKVDAAGFAIPETIRTVYQPARPDNQQTEIIADVDELIRFWKGH